ncbi:LOW QUALITY PROTEIN: protein FAM91A1-like [Symsagittifera roscoffensis]|uniref:LOW QUALITY PROTEIN: protein FAM91A1-like n=1 Tax=Symsagittifera roscoffensis TaxID=84072 RepID=UPI00307B2EDA
MGSKIEEFIRAGVSWVALPEDLQSSLSNSELEYSKLVKQFSTRCQLRYRDHLINSVYKDERQYYKQMIDYCIDNLMVFPYHLSDIFHTLHTSPFVYYTSMVRSLMKADKSYDSLPNFTAVDCLRVLGIGRNQYIDLMNQSRLQKNSSLQKFFKKKAISDLLPKEPIKIKIENWWRVRLATVTETDVLRSTPEEKELIDFLVANKRHLAGKLDLRLLRNLYSHGMIFFDVPITEIDTVSLPPLDNFVMNRTSGDEIELLLYKLFQVLDETMTMKELATMLDLDVKTVLMTVSLMCRLGFCHKRKSEMDQSELHESWLTVENGTKEHNAPAPFPVKNVIDFIDMDELSDDLLENSPIIAKSVSTSQFSLTSKSEGQPLVKELELSGGESSSRCKIAFLFDSTLTAFLMMGNLTPGLKTHAVTMFEVGKLSDESMDSFISELEKVKLDIDEQEGEAQRYFDHAQILHRTLKLLRYNDKIAFGEEMNSPGIDLLRCESLLNLEFDICQRLMQKNYQALISMAPLSQEVSPVSCLDPYHVGPFIPEMNSPWFKLFLYRTLGRGPPSMLLCKGFRLRQIPVMFLEYEKLLVTCWGHDSSLVSTCSCLIMLNDALCNMPVLVQGYSRYSESELCTKYVPFPLDQDSLEAHKGLVASLENHLDVTNGFGFLTLAKTPKSKVIENIPQSEPNETPENSASPEIEELTPKQVQYLLDCSSISAMNQDEECKDEHYEWSVFDVDCGLPLFDEALNSYVCDILTNSGIFSQEHQQKFLQSNLTLSMQLLKFIKACCENDLKSEEMDVRAYIRKRAPLQMPTCNVLYSRNSKEVKLWKF